MGVPKIKHSVLRRSWPPVTITSNHNQTRYKVDGRPIEGRKFFSTRAEALAYADELARLRDEGGVLALNIPAELRAQAVEAAAILEGTGRDLVDAARFLKSHLLQEEAKKSSITLEAALDCYLASKTAECERGELSKLTVSELTSKQRLVRAAFSGWNLSDIDEAAVKQFVDSLPHNARGRHNIRTKLGQFLNFCKKQKWINNNPVEAIRVRVPSSDVSVLSVGKVENLLRVAEISDRAEKVIPYLTISLFAGLRPGEAEQLRWEQIDFDTKEIEVLGKTSKTKQTRIVSIEETLLDWLNPYRKKSGCITESRFRYDWEDVRRRAGFALNGLDGEEWPADVLRHNYGSNWLAIYNDRAHLAELMGTSIAVIKKHYRKAIRREDAERYWRLRPDCRK